MTNHSLTASLTLHHLVYYDLRIVSCVSGECSSLQRDEDAESGNGPSLPQSPHSVEGAIGGPKSVDSDFEEPKYSFFDKK